MKVYTYILHTLCFAAWVVNAASVAPGSAPSSMSSAGWFGGLGWAKIPPADFDFWKEVTRLGKKASDYADKQLSIDALKEKVDKSAITNFTTTLQDAVKAAHDVFVDINFEEFSDAFDSEVEKGIQKFKAEFSEPLSGNQTEKYKKRAVALDTALDYVEDAFIKASKLNNVSEDESREKFNHVRPHIRSLVLIMGNLADNHPLIVDAIVFSVVIAIIPEGFIMRPLLRIFGFGPLGPVKGSAAAWCQRFFFGARVEGSSWFAMLQRAGMNPRGLWGFIGRLFGL